MRSETWPGTFSKAGTVIGKWKGLVIYVGFLFFTPPGLKYGICLPTGYRDTRDGRLTVSEEVASAVCLAAWHTQRAVLGAVPLPSVAGQKAWIFLGGTRVCNGGMVGSWLGCGRGAHPAWQHRRVCTGAVESGVVSAGGPGAEMVRMDQPVEVASPTSRASVRGHQKGALRVTLQWPYETKSWVNVAKCWIPEKMAMFRLCPSPPSTLGPPSGLWAQQRDLGALSWERENQSSGPTPPSICF